MRKPTATDYSGVKIWRGLKPFDILIVLVAVVLSVVSAWALYGQREQAAMVIIEGGGSSWVYPLDSVATIQVAGPLGETEVLINNGQASVVSSPCANQSCVAAGSITSVGQWIACLPNGVMVRIEGPRDEDALDAATY